ncbi:MAG: hypothetical protein ACO3Z6_09795 [Pseudomonadales bacterium]
MRLLCNCLALLLLAGSAQAELDLRLKTFGTLSDLPSDDALASVAGDPVQDTSVDLRTLFRSTHGAWQLTLDHTIFGMAGDTAIRPQVTGARLGGAPDDDSSRRFDLTWRLGSNEDGYALHRLDRMAIDYRGTDWGLSLGRRAVSWGGGMVFQPLDLFAPFAPTAVDRDYKPGEDMALVDRLFANGSDLQMLAVFRRDETGRADADVGSFGVKWHRPIGAGEIEFIAGEHFDDRVVGASLRVPMGGAMLRSDVLQTHTDDGRAYWSALLNMDVSTVLGGRNVITFAEAFRNGFGVANDRPELLALPSRLRARLERGEVFSLQRHYFALGATIEWHPLVNQQITAIRSVDDGSSLLQAELRLTPTDALRVDVGVLVSLGSRGEEFGALPLVSPSTLSAPGADALAPTVGGERSIYVRAVWFGRLRSVTE